MVKGLYTARTGMVNEQRRVDVLSNNLANASTTGFKKEGTVSESFADVLAYKIKDTSEPVVARRLGKMNLGVKIGETYTDYEEGSFQGTGNTFDLALAGKGFFAVEFTNKAGETSTMYTRDGHFIVDSAGMVVNKNGDFLLDKNGQRIKLDPILEHSLDENGVIYEQGAAVTQVQVADFGDYNYLEKYGETYFTPVDGAQEIEAEGRVISGYLENSNVNVVHEMVELITYQRAYETNQKMIQAFDTTLGTAVELGKL